MKNRAADALCPNVPIVEQPSEGYRESMSPSALTKLSFTAAATCGVSAIVYLFAPSSQYLGPPRGLVLAAGLVGAISLAVAGRWQQGAAEGARGLQLAVLTALAGAYLLTNVGGVTISNLGAWVTPFIVGIVAGAVLFAAAARALLKDQRAAQHA